MFSHLALHTGIVRKFQTLAVKEFIRLPDIIFTSHFAQRFKMTNLASQAHITDTRTSGHQSNPKQPPGPASLALTEPLPHQAPAQH
jgi:hypothetical protein